MVSMCSDMDVQIKMIKKDIYTILAIVPNHIPPIGRISMVIAYSKSTHLLAAKLH